MPEKKVRTDRLILLAVGLFMAASVLVVVFLREVGGQELPIVSDRVLLSTLTLTIGVLILALSFVLLRNLIKLFVEGRPGVLGTRFRTKLVVSFLVLCLIPSVVLFYGAATLIDQALVLLFSTRVEDMTVLSEDVAKIYNDDKKAEARQFARQIASEITASQLLTGGDALRVLLRQALEAYHLDFVNVYGVDGKPFVHLGLDAPARGNRAKEEAPAELSEPKLSRALGGEQYSWLERMRSGHRISGVVPIFTREGGRQVSGVVEAGYYIGENVSAKTEQIAQASQEYHKLKANRREIKRVYITFFLLLTLLIVFSATWLGMYLARQITVPIQSLAEGTREIAAGNLDFRVQAHASDEIGELIRSFNRMTEDIQRKGRQLEERRRYIETLLENVPAGVISLDRHGRITTLNKAAYRLLGLDPARDITQLPFEEAFCDPALAPLCDLLRDMAGSSGIHATRELALSAGGRTVNLAASVSNFLDPEGRSLGALVVLEDLTLLIRAQKSAAWREAARRIAHEIKNPLTPIQLSAQRILKKYRESAADLPRVVEEGTATIISEVASLKTMVDEFSRFARVPPVATSPKDPKAVIESALSLYDGTRPGLRFVRDYDPAPVQAMLDPEQMKRVLINLIDNAVEAMPDGGTITVSMRPQPGRGVLRIVVADDGPGIGREDKERLFLPYFSTKRRGTGLGLAIVNRIVSDHGGSIRLEDNVPHGTRFIIEIPSAGETHAG